MTSLPAKGKKKREKVLAPWNKTRVERSEDRFDVDQKIHRGLVRFSFVRVPPLSRRFVDVTSSTFDFETGTRLPSLFAIRGQIDLRFLLLPSCYRSAGSGFKVVSCFFFFFFNGENVPSGINGLRRGGLLYFPSDNEVRDVERHELRDPNPVNQAVSKLQFARFEQWMDGHLRCCPR